MTCDVGSPYPGTEEGPKGLAVRQLKGYASWVQTVQELSVIFGGRLLNGLNPEDNDNYTAAMYRNIYEPR